MLRHHRIVAVPYGFRSSFRELAAEGTDHPRKIVEAAPVHVVMARAVDARLMLTAVGAGSAAIRVTAPDPYRVLATRSLR